MKNTMTPSRPPTVRMKGLRFITGVENHLGANGALGGGTVIASSMSVRSLSSRLRMKTSEVLVDNRMYLRAFTTDSAKVCRSEERRVGKECRSPCSPSH